jgi:polar amino acid transport system substrate-binding protein
MHSPSSPIRHLSHALLGLMLLTGNAAHADQLDTILAAKKLRVAIDLAVPPYSMKDDKLKLIGSDVETAQLMARDFGLELEVIPTTLTNRVPYLQTNKADVVVSAFSITPERARVIDFSVPYAPILVVVGAPKGMKIFNPSFDVTPHQYISGIITEAGVLKAPFKRSIKRIQKLLKTT